MTKILTIKDLMTYTTSELEDLYSLVMDTLVNRQGNPVYDFMEDFSKSLICPHCGSIRCVKNGSVRGKKRFVCRDCERSFGTNPESALKHSNLKPEKWKKYIQCMVNGYTLQKSAGIVGVCLKTSFYMRHKILSALARTESPIVEGTIQMDETFVAESFKGNHKKSGFKLPRKARKRGHENTTRGVSKEQICIGTAIDHAGASIMRMAGKGRITNAQLEKIFEGRISEGSTLWTDSLGNYKTLAKRLKAHHEMIPSGQYSKGEVNLAHVNSLHSRFKNWLDRFNGVSTKHLGNYVAWFHWLESTKNLKENARPRQLLKDALENMVDVRIETIRFQVPAFVSLSYPISYLTQRADPWRARGSGVNGAKWQKTHGRKDAQKIAKQLQMWYNGITTNHKPQEKGAALHEQL